MASEFVFVKFPTSRIVYVDGNRAGFTNTIFVIESGHHEIDLGKPKNYRPDKHEISVEDTSVIEPLELEFEKVS